MDVSHLLDSLKLHGRIDTDSENEILRLMLETAAQDVAHAASYTLPAELADLPADMAFAIIDQASKLYDQRGADDAPAGLSLAASRIVARYRGVSLGQADG